MSNRIVKGFGGNAGSQEIPRQMAIAKQIGQPVSEYTGPVSANIMFSRVDLAFHTEDEGPVAHRPYLAFQGKIRSVSAVEGQELPGNVGTVMFEEVNAPAIRGRWELSNMEIAELSEKGCFGGNSQVMPKGLRPVATDPENPFREEMAVRSQLQVPNIFTEVPFEGVPIECVCQCMSVDINGRDVPVFVATPVGKTAGQNDIILTSAATGYNSLSQYFDNMQYYENGDPSEKKEYVTVDEWLSPEDEAKAHEEDQRRADAAKRVETSKTAVTGPKVLSPAEDAERAKLAALRAAIEDRVVQANISGHGGVIDQSLAYEDQAAEMAEAMTQQNGPQAAQEGRQEGLGTQDGSKYLQIDEPVFEASESDLDKLDKEASGQWDESDNPFSDKDDEKRRQEAGADAALDQQKAAAAEEAIRAAQKEAERIAGMDGNHVSQQQLGED